MLALLVFFAGFMLFSSAGWVVRKFGEVTYEQIMFHLNINHDQRYLVIYLYIEKDLK